MINNSYPYKERYFIMINKGMNHSEATGEILNTLHTSFKSDREIVNLLYGKNSERIPIGRERRAITVGIKVKGNKSFLYLLSNPHGEQFAESGEFGGNSGEISWNS